MASIKKRGNSYLVTVSCGRDSQYKKITKTATFRPDLYTARGNPKSEGAIQKEVAAFAADFERRVKTENARAEGKDGADPGRRKAHIQGIC